MLHAKAWGDYFTQRREGAEGGEILFKFFIFYTSLLFLALFSVVSVPLWLIILTSHKKNNAAPDGNGVLISISVRISA